MSNKLEPVQIEALSSIEFAHRSKQQFFIIKIKRNTAFALIISILIHLFVLFSFSPKKITGTSTLVHSLPQNMSVRLADLPKKKTLPIRTPRPVIAVENKAPVILPKPVPVPIPVPVVPKLPDNTTPKDLMSFVKARRQHSQELEEYAANENAQAHTPSDEELRDANIRKNLQQPGTSGIFEIRYKSSSAAQFSFKGWKNDYSIPKLELIDVKASAGEDIDLAIIRKMIAIIRREYKGDFNWESQRLGRVIVLSARLSDNAGLEEFLMQEFFSDDRF